MFSLKITLALFPLFSSQMFELKKKSLILLFSDCHSEETSGEPSCSKSIFLHIVPALLLVYSHGALQYWQFLFICDHREILMSWN